MSLYIDIENNLPSFDLKVNFEHKNGILGFLGASGSGKSMTLKCLSGLVTPSKGKIILNNLVLFDSEKKINLSPQKRKVGYLFQNYALFPNMNIIQNIEIGISHFNYDKKKSLCKEYIERLGLTGLEKHYPWQLSGGQQQRVALARALITSPDILLLDEPFSALDQHLRNNLEKELTSILKDYSGNVIFVTHDIAEAYRMCSEIIVYDKGISLEKREKNDLFKRPKNLSEATLTGCKNISKARKTGEHTIYAENWGHEYTIVDKIPNDVQYICIRAHNIEIAQDNKKENTFPYKIGKIIENPFEFTVYMKNSTSSEATLIEYKVEKKNMNFTINETVYLTFSNEHLFYF
ncbi:MULTISPECIES: ATP-binding cassette domain-containing protein [unclassified Clostridium]|uniref:sulfate/molybdate ABC transporter ATP-binding protein n=1 Tax=unclassified Clostridium TaxID=2614128 RepID=UPI000297E9C7|nr:MULTISPECIES: ATP-binding cassette domain-containing protein [unclassified Clostridium]EKQ52342.1 MAG: ABC-type sulfate/molybdate transport system, ATPase component [Clostridium sp. Maddingley MBC34-26]